MDSELSTRGSSAFARPTEKRSVMICWNRLRVDASDGSQGMEYRIEDGRVESRNLDLTQPTGEFVEIGWQPLTPEQLTTHVMEGAALANWLLRRMGIRALLRACSRMSSATSDMTQGLPRTSEVVIGEFSPLLTKVSDSSAECITNG
jgi:hypothetical protein